MKPKFEHVSHLESLHDMLKQAEDKYYDGQFDEITEANASSVLNLTDDIRYTVESWMLEIASRADDVLEKGEQHANKG